MDIALDPPRGAAGVALGMPIREAERILSGLYGCEAPGYSRGSRGVAHFSNGMTIQAHADGVGMVEAVEIYRPNDPTVRVLYGDISVFGDRCDVVEERLRSRVRIEIINDGATVVAPDLFLALGRDESVSGEGAAGEFFESVVVAAPGYYDDLDDPSVTGPAPNSPEGEQAGGQESLF
ncbi:hypothetical protein [Verrucosispora sp. ts21]|uniref:hypothetical protein n=1 Tax=Verrucosispora sp. ts21 TaxID=2069341 RepID=UPI0011AF8E83|nr:hypothetical protein [Verrucosispora sp. ts21]